MAFVPTVDKHDREVLSQEIDDETGNYRIRAGKAVHYLTIGTDVFDDDTMCRPYLLLPELPDFPDGEFTKMKIEREADGTLWESISWDSLPAVEQKWHPKTVDVLSLKEIQYHKAGVREVLYNGCPAIAKIACFGWSIPCMERETLAYSIIHQHQETGVPALAPAFLAHLTENGRVIGMLLEKLEGEFASIDDLPACEEAVRRVHRMGMIHGDVNRYNFITDRSRNLVWVIDFENSGPYEEPEALAELQSLPAELTETTGRGGPSRIIDSPKEVLTPEFMS